MAASSFEKEFTITTDEGLANFIEVLKGNPPPLILPEHPYDHAVADAQMFRWLRNMRANKSPNGDTDTKAMNKCSRITFSLSRQISAVLGDPNFPSWKSDDEMLSDLEELRRIRQEKYSA